MAQNTSIIAPISTNGYSLNLSFHLEFTNIKYTTRIMTITITLFIKPAQFMFSPPFLQTLLRLYHHPTDIAMKDDRLTFPKLHTIIESGMFC